MEMKPHNQDDPHRRKPDISRAKKQLNWSPVVSIYNTCKVSIGINLCFVCYCAYDRKI